jgi:hypothetical protein
MRIWVIAAAVVLGFAGFARADALDLKEVAGDAKWAAHLDVDAMRAASVVVKAHDLAMEKCPPAHLLLEAVKSRIGMDPRTDVRSVTIYGKQIGQPEHVLIIDANFNQTLLLEKAKSAPDHKVTTYGSYELHSWVQNKGKHHEHPVTGVFYKPTVLVIGPCVDQVKAALDVLDGKAANQSAAGAPLAGEVPAGAILVVRAVGIDSAKVPCHSPLIKQSESLRLALGENQGESFLSGCLQTKCPIVADQVKTVIEGGRALALLQHGYDEDSVKLINSMKVAVKDKAVTVEFRAPADDVWKQAVKVAKEIIQHHKAMQEHRAKAPKVEQ